MAANFASPEWQLAIADTILATEGKQVAAALNRAIEAIVNHEGTCLIAFHRNARPDVLHHTLEPAGRKHYLEKYLDGTYLLDPLYQLALRTRKAGLVRFRDELPDRFRSSEYYRQYSERTHLLDEMDFLAAVTAETTLVLVIGRRESMFTRAELNRLETAAPIVQACISKIWAAWISRPDNVRGKDDMHKRLTECFDNFGDPVLTRRERQISQLLLRGHSSKSIARELRIAPGTVMVHKRNLFAKLGVSSQYELFSLLIDDLSRI